MFCSAARLVVRLGIQNTIGPCRNYRLTSLFSFKGSPEILLFRASCPLNLTDYGIEPPNILFYSVNEQVYFRVETVMK